MDKATLIADEPGACLSLRREMIVLEQPDGARHRIGLQAVKQILVRGDVYMSSRLLDDCLGVGVSVVILPGRRQAPARHLFPQPRGALAVRLAQSTVFLDPARRLQLAQEFVVGKIAAQGECLTNRGVRYPWKRFVSSARGSSDITSLMGVEGAASARYFGHWAGLLDPQWGFMGRNRRPPRDPVNALLSLGYTLTCHAVGRLAGQEGYEPALGFLHAPASGRPSLALDLLEPLRAWIDEWVLTQCSEGIFTTDDFVVEGQYGCRLTKTASRQFFHRWYATAENWLERLSREQLASLRQALDLSS